MKRTSTPWTLEQLLELLKAPNPADRRNAASRLEFSYYNDPNVLEPLIQALDDPDPGVRNVAAHCLGTMSHVAQVAHVAKQAIGQLIALLDDEDEEVVASSIYALGQLGNSSVAPKLLPFLDYPDRPDVKICRVTIEALRQLQYQPAIPHFRRLLRDSRPGVCHDAILALFSMRQLSSQVEQILRSVADDLDSPLEETARDMLQIIANEKQSG